MRSVPVIEARRDKPDVVEALLRELVADQARQAAEQARQGETLATILRLLERGRGARDQADVGLLVAAAESLGDRTFTSAQVKTLAAAVPALRDALEAADIDDAQQLGCVFRRLEGKIIEGLCLEACQRSAGQPVVWRVLVCGG
jgi:hypothetical protein